MAESPTAPMAAAAAPRPTTPVAPRPLTPTSPAAAPSDSSPTQRVLGVFFPDDDNTIDRVHECPVCLRPFSLVRFKHRCKACDRNVCNDCSKSRLRLDDMGLDGAHTPKRGGNHHVARKDRGHKSSRVCDPCARSYFESKLEADSTCPSTPVLTPLVSPAPPPLSLDMTSNACLPISTPSLQHLAESTLPSHNLVARPSTTKWLRRRHFVFFGVFSFFVVVRLLTPRRPRPQTANVSGAFLGTDAALAAIHRMTRLDVFAVGLLVLIAVDEWLAFQRSRAATKTRTSLNSSRKVPLTSEAHGAGGDGAMAPDASLGTAAPIPVDVEASSRLVGANDDINLDQLSQVLTDSFNEGSLVTVASYSNCSAETSKLLVCFGKATAFAGSTVAGYIESIESTLATLGLQEDATSPTLRDVVAKEVELGTAASGGKKNPSISRCVLRLLWFLEFVETMLGVLVDANTGDDIGSGVSKAYESTLGTRHPWLIRKGVMTALSSCPLKSAVLAKMVLAKPSQDKLATLADIQRQMKAVIATTRAILTEKDLMDIK